MFFFFFFSSMSQKKKKCEEQTRETSQLPVENIDRKK